VIAEWYLAKLVMKITVAGDPRSVVHQNLTLIRASSPVEAYEKALTFGKAGEVSYDNPNGKAVQICFEGISDLTEIYDNLEDGSELAFTETVGMPEEQIRTLILPRNRLTAFLPPRPTDGPDYRSGEVIAKVERMINRSEGNAPEN
jgi:hypothetical protein